MLGPAIIIAILVRYINNKISDIQDIEKNNIVQYFVGPATIIAILGKSSNNCILQRGGARSLSEVRQMSLHWYAFVIESYWQFAIVACFCAKLVKYHENWFKIVQSYSTNWYDVVHRMSF